MVTLYKHVSSILQTISNGSFISVERKKEDKNRTEIWKPLQASNSKTIANVELPLPPPHSSEKFPAVKARGVPNAKSNPCSIWHPWVHSGSTSVQAARNGSFAEEEKQNEQPPKLDCAPCLVACQQAD